MKSLDPRVNRLPGFGAESHLQSKAPLDQLGTFEVFLQMKEGKPFEHAGIVHAPNKELAFVMAKEQYSRRYTCTGLAVTDTRDITLSPFTEADNSAYNVINVNKKEGEETTYQVFHLLKRGKQHVFAAEIEAVDVEDCFARAKEKFADDKPVYNIWVVKKTDMLYSTEEDKMIWDTLPEKKFRDAADYKAADKIKAFKERTNQA
ncbi:MAG TPA: phenylacetic acid degradation b [Cyclobacteriaceae bacterium]|nr:phenylacetic acid degradation b [Cyclobacteriaceae bacterium]